MSKKSPIFHLGRSASLLFLFSFILLSPLFSLHAHAAGLVPCQNIITKSSDGSVTVSDSCNVCQVFRLSQNILNFIYDVISIPLGAIMLLWGGILILTGGMRGDPGAAQRGKKILTNTLIGLGIAFFAWIAIDTIIKTLAGGGNLFNAVGPWNKIECEAPGDVTFSAPPKPPAPPTPLPDNPPTAPKPYLDNVTARARIRGAGMDISSTSTCSDQNNPNCTSLQNIPAVAVDELIRLNTALKSACSSCNLTVSGGTEVGHKTHGSGISIVDLSARDDRINQFIKNLIGTPSPKINTWYRGGDDHFYFYEGDHWHVCLTSACAPHNVRNDQIRGL